MINVTKKSFFLRLILVIVLQLTLLNVHAFSTENQVALKETNIPYKKDDPRIENAASKYIVMFVVLLILAIGIYVITRKYSLIRWQSTGTESDAVIQILQIKRLTANSTVLQISVDGKIHTILESKCNINLINPE